MKKIITVYLLPAVFWLGAWFLISALIQKPLVLPGPILVLRRLGELLTEGAFYAKTALSLVRVLVGMITGTFLGILLAVLTESCRPAGWILTPAIRILRTIPVASFIILILLWVGKGKVPGVISALVVLPLIFESTAMGIRETPKELLEMARCYEMSKLRIWRYIRIPSVMPHLMSGLSNAIGLAWKSGVAAEVLCVPARAIGTEVYHSKIYLETPDLFAWTLVVVVLSLIIENRIRRRVGKEMAKWN